MDEIIIRIENGNYLHLQFSDESADDALCDSCIDYTVYDENKKEIDGGLMEYDAEERGYSTIEKAIGDVIDFAYDRNMKYEETELTLEDGFEE